MFYLLLKFVGRIFLYKYEFTRIFINKVVGFFLMYFWFSISTMLFHLSILMRRILFSFNFLFSFCRSFKFWFSSDVIFCIFVEVMSLITFAASYLNYMLLFILSLLMAISVSIAMFCLICLCVSFWVIVFVACC